MHVPRLRALCISAVLIVPSAASSAQALPTSLPTLVEQAWQRSPTARGMVARQGEVDATRAVSASWIAGQPVLGLSQRRGRWIDQGQVRESEVSISAPFSTPGQRSARRGLADLSAAELQAHTAKARLDIAGQVRARLWDAAAAQAMQEEKAGHLHHSEELAEEIGRRVAAGELAKVDALLMDQEVQGARIAVEQAKADALASLAKLRILAGPFGALPFAREPLVPEPIAGKAAIDSPHVLAARATSSRAAAALRLAQATRSAAPTVSLSLRHERDPLLAGPERSVGLALQIPIGSAGRNRPAEAQAHTQIAVAAAEAAQAQDSNVAELELARAQLGHAHAALAASDDRVNAMREHQRLIEKAFRLGERGLGDLLRSRALAHEAQVAQRQQQVAVGRAHAEFNQASGVLP